MAKDRLSFFTLLFKKTFFFLSFGLIGIGTVSAQSYKVSGKIIDKTDNQPVIGAFVFLTDVKDTTNRVAGTTDVDGKFLLTGLKKKAYHLTIQSINYEKIRQEITLTKQVTDLGTFTLEMASKMLKEVVVVGQGTAVQKGDTTVMTAESFKVTQDANAEDLVKKMPGITVENGTVSARGEKVEKVLVDGKPFFGDDPSVALRNLPAEVIDRVQVFNKLSDQAELTGFDDGQSSRTINIITKKSSKFSSFGKFTGGTNFDDKYLAGGSFNLFRGQQRFTFSGMTNNINQSNFAMQDLIGATSGGSMRTGWGGRSFGDWGGISKNSSLGFNYIDNWGKKISVSGSYFYNTSSTTRITNKDIEYLLIDQGNFEQDSAYTTSKNQNHRLNMRIEYNIDSMNSMVIVPRFSLQDNSNNSFSQSLISGGDINSQSIEQTFSDNLGYNLGNDLTWRHKFVKKGRTLSIRSSVSYDKRNNDITDLATVDTIPDNQLIDGLTNNLNLNTNFNYTEPLGKFSQLQFNYNNNFRGSDNSRKVFALDPENHKSNSMDSLSNVYNNNLYANRVGLSWLYNKKDLNLMVGLNYERSDLKGQQDFPKQAKVNETFQSFLPNLMLNYKFSAISNLRVFYRTETDVPSITELQNAIDNSDRRKIRTGNPFLKQEYSHNLMSNFSYANPTSGFNAFVFVRGQYAKNIISNKTIYAQNDTLLRPDGIDVTLYPGSQLSYPVNLDHSYQLNSMINLSYFVKPIKSNVSLVNGFNYNQTPEFAQTLINRSNNYSLMNSLIITSNISSNVDFTVSYTSNYSITKYSLDFMDRKIYWYQSASAKLNLILWKGIVFNTDVVGQYNKGSQMNDDYTEQYFVWNASIGKKFLKSKAAEVRLGAYDILNQNQSISRSVTATSMTDTRINAYKRYFLVLFTYNLRSSRGAPQEKQEPGRTFPGGPPPGMPPGGFRPGGGPPAGGPQGGYHDHGPGGF
ncbi:MAG TPA: TonB-dependent receptor [Bacteroidales bacterium]|nr:TonB-dependent receptor [Bacteroidales bacterium]